MQVSVTFRHFDPSDSIREYVTTKVQKVAHKYLRNAQDAHVILSIVKRRHHAEINIHAAHFDIAAHEQTEDLHAAIDLALDKVEAQMRKHKDRINHHKGRQPTAGSVTEIPVDVIEGDEDAESPRRVIETDAIPAKPLSVDDAILQLELTHAEFLVFRNSTNDLISVLYRRRDGNFGLIAPTA